MKDNDLDDIEALKAKRVKKELTDDERQRLRKEVKKIIERREAEEKLRRRAEMERFYEFDLYT